jgi:hypothetical protein
MSLMYFIPVIAIVAVFGYVFWYRAGLNKALAAGQGPFIFHSTYAGTFSSLAAEEYIIALWQGLAYTGSESAAAQVGSAVLNEISSKAIGYSKYTPQVFAALTSHGRLLVAEEYSDMGMRGNYNEVRTWGHGASAMTGAAAVPGHHGPPPKNPFNPSVSLQLAMLRGPDGSQFPCWLSPQGLEVTGQQRPISAALPIAPEAASHVWHSAVQQAAPPQAA